MCTSTASRSSFQDRFRDHLVATDKSDHTIDAYTRDVRFFSEWFDRINGREFTPERITPIDVREYRRYLLTVKNYKPATVNRKLSSVSAFCEWARETDLVSANPANGISQVDEVRTGPKWLDKSEQDALLRAVQEKGRKRDIALITLMLTTGLRVSEVSRLTVEDVRISPRKGSVTIRGRKGEKSRIVPLNVDARQALQAHLSASSLHKDDLQNGSYLFVGQRGGPLQPSGVYYLVNRYACDARLEDVTPHTLRHTFGKNLVDAGLSLDRVAQLLGHKSVNMTRLYATLREQESLRDVKKTALT